MNPNEGWSGVSLGMGNMSGRCRLGHVSFIYHHQGCRMQTFLVIKNTRACPHILYGSIGRRMVNIHKHLQTHLTLALSVYRFLSLFLSLSLHLFHGLLRQADGWLSQDSGERLAYQVLTVQVQPDQCLTIVAGPRPEQGLLITY